ncbi:MAG: 4-hydroxy-tetrahydrodipicolinate synthase [Xanthomonadales bacterium]|nr:4-hydroxy-tetrahydrodipicolinate synthase [Xanthomonadales bacterium]
MFNGSIVALVTPMDQHGRLDISSLRRLIDFHLQSGTSALVVAGTTGESATLDHDEFIELVAAVTGHVAGAIPVIAGTGTASTTKSVEMTLRAAELKADAVLVVMPYYNRPTQSGLKAHFRAIADASSIPVILYNVPPRTGTDMAPDTALELAAHERIVGIKEAVADMARIQRLVGERPEGFCVLSGDDGSCAEAMSLGAEGVISVAANVDPRRMSALCTAATAGDRERCGQLDSELRELFAAMGIEPNPIPAKWALAEMGLIGPGIRLPLQTLDSRHHATVRSCLKNLELA